MSTKDETTPLSGKALQPAGVQATCRCVDWYVEGESRVVECDGVRVIVRYVGRKGRRARIVIEAPAAASFEPLVDAHSPPVVQHAG